MELWPGKPPDETADIGLEKTRLSPRLDRTQVEVTAPPAGGQREPADDHDLPAAAPTTPGARAPARWRP